MVDLKPLQVPEECANCKKPGTKERPLKQCAKCKSTSYCTRECLKLGWKTHKKQCAKQAQDRATRIAEAEARLSSNSASIAAVSMASASADSTAHLASVNTPIPPPTDLEPFDHYANEGPALAVRVPTPFLKLKERRWIHDRPKEDVFKLLIDAYRLRLDDDVKFLHTVHKDTIYTNTDNDGLVSLDRFLQLAESADLMPPWWSAGEITACLTRGCPLTWSNTSSKITLKDVNKYYGDPLMGLQLRIFGEQVVERELIGDHLLKMMEVQVILERASDFMNFLPGNKDVPD